MSKKEILIILFLAGFLTWWVSFSIYMEPLGLVRFRGFPLTYWSGFGKLNLVNLLIDFLFWFLFLASVQWGLKKIKKRRRK